MKMWNCSQRAQKGTLELSVVFRSSVPQRPDLAKAVSMSESAFAHVFKAATGMAPLQFLQRLRMEHARTLLLSGSTVSEAAARVGYASLSHFSGVFKRHFGVLPRVYAGNSETDRTSLVRCCPERATSPRARSSQSRGDQRINQA